MITKPKARILALIDAKFGHSEHFESPTSSDFILKNRRQFLEAVLKEWINAAENKIWRTKLCRIQHIIYFFIRGVK